MMQPPDRRHLLAATARDRREHQCLPIPPEQPGSVEVFEDGEAVAGLNDNDVQNADMLPPSTEGDRVHTAAIAAWKELEQAEPEFAARVRRLFDAGRHKTIATLWTWVAVTSVSSSTALSRTASSGAVHELRPGSKPATTEYGQPGIICALLCPARRCGRTSGPGRSRHPAAASG